MSQESLTPQAERMETSDNINEDLGLENMADATSQAGEMEAPVEIKVYGKDGKDLGKKGVKRVVVGELRSLILLSFIISLKSSASKTLSKLGCPFCKLKINCRQHKLGHLYFDHMITHFFQWVCPCLATFSRQESLKRHQSPTQKRGNCKIKNVQGKRCTGYLVDANGFNYISKSLRKSNLKRKQTFLLSNLIKIEEHETLLSSWSGFNFSFPVDGLVRLSKVSSLDNFHSLKKLQANNFSCTKNQFKQTCINPLSTCIDEFLNQMKNGPDYNDLLLNTSLESTSTSYNHNTSLQDQLLDLERSTLSDPSIPPCSPHTPQSPCNPTFPCTPGSPHLPVSTLSHVTSSPTKSYTTLLPFSPFVLDSPHGFASPTDLPNTSFTCQGNGEASTSDETALLPGLLTPSYTSQDFNRRNILQDNLFTEFLLNM